VSRWSAGSTADGFLGHQNPHPTETTRGLFEILSFFSSFNNIYRRKMLKIGNLEKYCNFYRKAVK
jgi:hypothetical protein